MICVPVKGDDMIADLVRNNRSYRRFYQEVLIGHDTLKALVDLARCCASAANLQPLKYLLSCEPDRNGLIFKHLAWAAYLKDWQGPPEGERPSAYIIVLGDSAISKSFQYDAGIASQSILLGATEKGLGGCNVGFIDRDLLRKNLNIPKEYEILLVIALGKPKEKVVIEKSVKGDIEYYRDKNDVHHVPKRPLDEVIIK